MDGYQYPDKHACRCQFGLSGDTVDEEVVCRHVRADEPCAVSAETILELVNVTKEYGDEMAVSNVSLTVREGELLTIVGPSGCGKTTLLRLLAGVERPTGGTVQLKGETIADASTAEFVPPERRDIGLVFQEFALFPHMSVRENIRFGIKDWARSEREARIDELLSLVDLTDKGDCHPEDLSGGQRQRVALARSLAPEPEIVLLDEPFSNLDVALRVRMREEVREILKRAGVTAISVTHDQEEALSVSDRIAVMNGGELEQLGHPEAVFQQPKSRFVADFLGNASFLSGYLSGDEVTTPLGSIPRDHLFGLDPTYDDVSIDVLVRPDDLVAASARDDASNGYVTYRRYLGPSILYRIELDNGDVVECLHNHVEQLELGMRVRVRLHADHELAWFPSEHATEQTAPIASVETSSSVSTQ